MDKSKTQVTMNKGYYNRVLILFIGIAMGPVLFLAVLIFMRNGMETVPTDYNHPLLFASVIFSTIAVIGSILIYNFRLPPIKAKSDLVQKLEEWKKLLIIRMAIIEGACMFNIVCLLTEEFDIFLYLSIALIVLQFMNFPSRNKIQSDLNLSVEETASL